MAGRIIAECLARDSAKTKNNCRVPFRRLCEDKDSAKTKKVQFNLLLTFTIKEIV
jgi:hypothetical protein